MTTEKMTIHQALAELKTLEKRICTKIDRLDVCVANKHSNKKIRGEEIKNYVENGKADYESVTDLIARQFAIKKAVTQSNAITKVKIGGKEYTIAEAIAMKTSGIELKERLYINISTRFASEKNVCDNNNRLLSDKADDYIISMYGGGDKKTNIDEWKSQRADYIDANTFELVECIECKKEIDRLEAEINDFEVEVDSALSVSNANTEITIEY